MNKVSPDMAEVELGRMCEFFDVELSTEGMVEEEQDAMRSITAKIEKAICNGSLVIGDHGQPTYTTKKGTDLTFKEPTGATLLVKTKGDDSNVRKMLAIAMDLTGGVTSPAKLSIKDTGVISAIVNLFMSELA